MATEAGGVRVRLAPSPTGPAHIGTLHTTLFNYLFARARDGSFVLRLEDTDRERSHRRWERQLIEDMRWLGLDWDEGPEQGGPHGPYRQSERTDTYRRFLQRLRQQGDAYPCFCSDEELAAERRRARERDEVYRYSGRCRRLTDDERRRRLEEGAACAWRFCVPRDREVVWDDMVRGEIRIGTDAIGDFVVARSDGTPLYNFAVTVDDHTMGITHVLRGEDHIANTAPQLLMYQALGFRPPRFGHLGHILAPGGGKLSKRRSSGQVKEYREAGILPEAMFNYLALLGWTPPQAERELWSPEELVAAFGIDRVTAAPATFDNDKLTWFNRQHIDALAPEDLVRRALPFLRESNIIEGEPADRQRLEAVLQLVKSEVDRLAELPAVAAVFYGGEVAYGGEARQALGSDAAPEVLQRFRQALEQADRIDSAWTRDTFNRLRQELPYGARDIFMPVRAALTGAVHGPAIYDLVPLLGRERTLRRVDDALGA